MCAQPTPDLMLLGLHQLANVVARMAHAKAVTCVLIKNILHKIRPVLILVCQLRFFE
jgi:hypothetical protein